MNNALPAERAHPSSLQELLPSSILKKLNEEKIIFVQEHYGALMNFVTQDNITMHVLGQVLHSQDGERKIQYLLQEHGIKLMKSRGFIPSQMMQILKGEGWEEKIAYIQQEDFKKIYNSGLEICHIAGLFTCGDWKEKMGFVMTYRKFLAYERYKNYKKPVDMYKVLLKADWNTTSLVKTIRQKGGK